MPVQDDETARGDPIPSAVSAVNRAGGAAVSEAGDPIWPWPTATVAPPSSCSRGVSDSAYVSPGCLYFGVVLPDGASILTAFSATGPARSVSKGRHGTPR